MPYKDKPIKKKYYTLGEVAKAASCEPRWIAKLSDDFNVNPKRGNPNNRRLYTEAKKDSMVKLRWFMADFRKCVEYCWKNGITI
jgi:hypothetical protein